MSLIKNLVKETENKPRRKKKDGEKGSGESDDEDKAKPVGPYIKSATELQRLKLEKLMKNPEKPIIIPEQRRDRDYMSSVPTFVRNVMGSSAGAGSGEFHVYRHLRRKEYARQKNIQNQSLREAADDAYQQKLDDNKRAAEERTAKKRAKRLKKKQRAKRPREQTSNVNTKNDSESSGSASEAEAEEPAGVETKDTEDTIATVAEKHTQRDNIEDVVEKPGPITKEQSTEERESTTNEATHSDEDSQSHLDSKDENAQTSGPKDSVEPSTES